MKCYVLVVKIKIIDNGLGILVEVKDIFFYFMVISK